LLRDWNGRGVHAPALIDGVLPAADGRQGRDVSSRPYRTARLGRRLRRYCLGIGQRPWVAAIICGYLGLSRQYVFGLFTDHHAAFFGREADDQAQLFLRPACIVPRYPNAVRMAQFRLAVMRGELLLGEYVLAVGLVVVRVSAGFVENIDGERAFDFHRFGFVVEE
jgi:hypothetical protein